MKMYIIILYVKYVKVNMYMLSSTAIIIITY